MHTCRQCGRDYVYNDEIGYHRELCDPLCDGIERGIAKEKAKAKESNTIMMPNKLTAENGAKHLLLGEFYESIILQCNECSGLGYNDKLMPCDACNGAGEYSQQVGVEWATIKDIYAMVIKHFET